MKTFFYSLWHDLKRNKFFNSLMFAQVLVLILLFTIMMGFSQIEELKLKFYDKSLNNLAIITVKESRENDFSDFVGKEGLRDVAVASQKKYFEKYNGYEEGGIFLTVSFANPKLVQLLSVPHSGEWFCGNDDGEYKEALVSLQHKEKYAKGQTYTVKDTYEKSEVKIKVIGYLGKDNITLTPHILYDAIYAQKFSDILVCDSSNIDLTKVNYFFADEKPAQFYIDTYSFEATTYKEVYQFEKERTAAWRYSANYIMTIVIAIIFVCIVANSVFKVEKDIKRNMLKYVVGNSNRNIVLGEIFKSIAIFAIPFLIDFAILPVIAEIMKKNSLENIIKWKNFYISTGIILAIYIISTFATLLRTVLAKPLDELRKE